MLKNILYCFLFLLIVHCSGSTTELIDTGSIVNTEKLINTPFEGLTTGDDFEYYFFQCGKFKTDTIDKFPIKIFTAFFTKDEEETIQEGIDIANNGIGFDAYQLTDIWSNDVRIIYKVDEIEYDDIGLLNSVANTHEGLYYFYDNSFSERISPDWAIELRGRDGIRTNTIAHELGHATGLDHCLIDYTNNTCDYDALEENSIMEFDGGTELTDYNFMMQNQGEIMKDHLGDTSGTLDSGFCPD